MSDFKIVGKNNLAKYLTEVLDEFPEFFFIVSLLISSLLFKGMKTVYRAEYTRLVTRIFRTSTECNYRIQKSFPHILLHIFRNRRLDQSK